MGNVMELAGAALGISAAVLGSLAVKKKKQDNSPKNKGSGITVLCGEFIGAAYDRETGLTRVEVRDTNGVTQTGFSKLSAKELETLYAGKGWSQIVTQKFDPAKAGRKEN